MYIGRACHCIYIYGSTILSVFRCAFFSFSWLWRPFFHLLCTCVLRTCGSATALHPLFPHRLTRQPSVMFAHGIHQRRGPRLGFIMFYNYYYYTNVRTIAFPLGRSQPPSTTSPSTPSSFNIPFPAQPPFNGTPCRHKTIGFFAVTKPCAFVGNSVLDNHAITTPKAKTL